MMVVVHVRRLESGTRAGALDSALRLFMWLEPYVAASFLFIAGYSIVLSHAKASEGWLKKLLRRALGLYALAVLLFVPQYGVELPDLLASPGILSAIALAIALVGSALSTRFAVLALSAMTLVVLSVTLVLDRSGATVSGLNAGPGGAFPIVAFSALGGLTAIVRQRFGDRALSMMSLASLPVLGVVLLSGAPWLTERASFYASHAGQLALASMGTDAPKQAMHFWNHSAFGALGLCAPLTLSLVVSLRFKSRVASFAPARPLIVLGRHALAAYVVHLGLLGVIDLAGLGPSGPAHTWAIVAAISLGIIVLSYVLDRLRPRKGRAPAPEPA